MIRRSVQRKRRKATPSHNLVSGHSLANKGMRAGRWSGLQDYRLPVIYTVMQYHLLNLANFISQHYTYKFLLC